MNGAGSVSIFVSQLFDKNILPLFIKITVLILLLILYEFEPIKWLQSPLKELENLGYKS